MFYIFDHTIEGALVPCYADTDSMALATTDTRQVPETASVEEKYAAIFEPIIKPEMRDSWEKTWKQWFVTTTDVSDTLFPGKLKCKFSVVIQLLTFVKVNLNSQKENSLHFLQSVISRGLNLAKQSWDEKAFQIPFKFDLTTSKTAYMMENSL